MPTTFTLATDLLSSAPTRGLLNNWAATLDATTSPDIDVTVFDPGTLVPTNETMAAVIAGTVDLAWVTPTVTDFPALEAVTLPMGFDPGGATSSALFANIQSAGFAAQGLTVLAAWFQR